MIRLLSVLLFLGASAIAGFAAAGSTEVNASAKKYRPSKPEADGLRLEVNADLWDLMETTGKDWTWGGAMLTIEVALHNVSSAPITVATTAYDEQPRVTRWPDESPGLERIVFIITSPQFQGKPTAFVAARFTPVVLAPGEYVLVFKHSAMIQDRKHADAIKEASVAFGVSTHFVGPKEWWRGSLQTYAPIRRDNEPEQFLAKEKVSQKKYDAQKEAEKDPGYGKANAAHVAALIAGSDEVHIRGEGAKETEGIVLRDSNWIQHVSQVIAATSLPHSGSCFCIGWRTAYFQQKGRLVISVAAIHGNQLRIYADGVGGDYKTSEADWKAVKQALEIPASAGGPAETAPKDGAESGLQGK
jgi:hypothetical protein